MLRRITYKRDEIIKFINEGYDVHTVAKTPDGKNIYAPIRKYKREPSGEFITTDSNDTGRDNLGNLPKFRLELADTLDSPGQFDLREFRG
jgi:hypothetical protein